MLPGHWSRLYRFDADRAREVVDGRIAGVDESGRGPLAGPVVAAAVILFKSSPLAGLNDSKQVAPKKRKKLFWEILQCGLVGVGVASEEIIDRINIYQATRLAMRQAVLSLTHTPSLLLIDGPLSLDLPLRQQPIIRGDQKSASIAAASIIAKVYRDALMEHYDRLYPDYLFKNHKGYATEEHRNALHRFGPCPLHRKSFSPVSAQILHRKEEFFSHGV